MESSFKILRKSVFSFLQNFEYFTATAALLAFPYAVSVLVFQSWISSSSILGIINSRIATLFDAAGFPSSSEFFTILNLKLSQTVAVSILAFPLTFSSFLLCTASVIQALGKQELPEIPLFSRLLRIYSPIFHTQICNSMLILSANATSFSLLLIAFNVADELGLSSHGFELFLSISGALFCSIILANTFTICNLSLVLSGKEKAGGFQSILKACALIKGRTGIALSLALPVNMAMAAVEALFQYRVVRVYKQGRDGLCSLALEGMFIAYLYGILLVLDTIVVCFFLRSCEDRRRSLHSHIGTEDIDHHDFNSVKILDDLP